MTRARDRPGWSPGMDVVHDELGRGWVWGSGRGVVTVRFETAETPAGPVRSYADDDPQLHPVAAGRPGLGSGEHALQAAPARARRGSSRCPR